MLLHASKTKGDLYIAHTAGGLFPAARAAKKHGKPFAFDAEDFHTGELPEGHSQNQQIRKLEKKYLPQAAYITAASPLIAQAYGRQYKLPQKITAINNVFSLELQPVFRPHNSTSPLRLFWFSQTLGRDRGLQDVLQALAFLKDVPIEVGLLGLCSETDRSFFQSFFPAPAHRLAFLPLRSEAELIQLSATYDIGLALERREPLNRDLCLTNKVFTYLLAGNAILASETQAQKDFMDTYPEVGCSYPIGDTQAVAQILRRYREQPEELESRRRAAWQLAREELNWEKEQHKFLDLVKSVL